MINCTGKHRSPSEFQRIVVRTPWSQPPIRQGNGNPRRADVVRDSFFSVYMDTKMGRSGAGFETTSATLMWWILAMAAFPRVQYQAQAELDAVVGRARLPTYADAPRLPYVRAIVREVLRWRPVVRLGTPHKTIEDDWYEGMFIPKGSVCRPNIWQCNRDPTVFGEDADDFKPERHLGDNGELLPGPKETNQEGYVSFGFGRRICVGKHLANDSLFILTARILWATNLRCVQDEGGMKRLLDTNAFVESGSIR